MRSFIGLCVSARTVYICHDLWWSEGVSQEFVLCSTPYLTLYELGIQLCLGLVDLPSV